MTPVDGRTLSLEALSRALGSYAAVVNPAVRPAMGLALSPYIPAAAAAGFVLYGYTLRGLVRGADPAVPVIAPVGSIVAAAVIDACKAF